MRLISAGSGLYCASGTSTVTRDCGKWLGEVGLEMLKGNTFQVLVSTRP